MLRFTVYDSPEFCFKSDDEGSIGKERTPSVDEMPIYWRAYYDGGAFAGDGYAPSICASEAYLLSATCSMWGAPIAKLYDRRTKQYIDGLE